MLRNSHYVPVSSSANVSAHYWKFCNSCVSTTLLKLWNGLFRLFSGLLILFFFKIPTSILNLYNGCIITCASYTDLVYRQLTKAPNSALVIDFGQHFFFGKLDMIRSFAIALSTDTAVWTANPDGLLMGFIKEILENLYILLGYGKNAWILGLN